MTTAPRPGWYLDPAGTRDRTGAQRFRWWDGVDWTDAISSSAQAPAPTGPLSRRARPAGRLRTALVISVGFVVFVGASIGAAAVLWRDPRSDAGGRSLAPAASAASAVIPSPSADPTGHLDLQTRWATVGQASMQLPDDPYALTPDPLELRGMLDVLFLANAPVHQRYDGRLSWSSAVLLGRLSDTTDRDGDLEARGKLALQMFSRIFFAGHQTALTDVDFRDNAVSGCGGLLITGRVSYQVQDLPSRYDTVTALLVRLDDGSVIIAVSSVPNDADPQLSTQAAAALESLTIH